MSENLSDSKLTFPYECMVGTIGELSKELAKGTEVPEEFYFVAGLTMMGAMCSPDLTLNLGMEIDTRFYTVLLGDSYSVKKSTAMRNILAFFSKLVAGRMPHVIHGVGSAEGLARELADHSRLVLALDELRSFLDKTKVQSSVLLPMTTSLFEAHDWDNATKDKTVCIQVRDAHLSLVGCCTTETYENMWNREAISIGFPNRLFLVNADAKPKIAWPEPPDEAVIKEIQTRIQQQIARLPLKYDIEPDAKEQWEQWYKGVRESIHTKRLDTIGLRLIPLLALSTDKNTIDTDTVHRVMAILDYELRLRTISDPIDADNLVAKLEEKIRRTLKAKTRLSKRELRRSTHADRDGIWAFNRALENLTSATDIMVENECYLLSPEVLSTALSPDLSPGA